MNRAHDIGRIRLDRVGIAAMNHGLRGHVDDDFGSAFGNCAFEPIEIANIPADASMTPATPACSKRLGFVGGSARSQLRPRQGIEPEREPASLKPVWPVTKTFRPLQNVRLSMLRSMSPVTVRVCKHDAGPAAASRSKCGIEHHLLPLGSTSGQFRSCSETTVASRGH
jgi:hypothetical protein